MGTSTATLSLKQTVAPSVEPLSTAEVKTHLRIDGTDDDTNIARLIKVARIAVEMMTGLALITQTYRWTMNRLDEEVVFPIAPVQSVGSITYVDINGSTQTLSSSLYDVDIESDRQRIVKAYSASYPSIRDHFNSVKITFDVGFGDAASDVPEDIRHALLLIIGEMDLYREDMQPIIRGTDFEKLPTGAKALLTPYRLVGF